MKPPVISGKCSISRELPINNHTRPAIVDHCEGLLHNSSLQDTIYKCQVADKMVYISNASGTIQSQLGHDTKKANATQSSATTITDLCVYKSEPIWTEANSLMLFIVLVSVVIIYTYVFNTYKQYRGRRKKQANALSELEEQVATLHKTKESLEGDVYGVTAELLDTKTQLNDNELAKIVLNEKLAKIEEELVVASAKTEEYKGSVFALQLNESELQYQNRDISMQFENAESTNKSLSNINSNILEKLNEIKSELEMEVKMNTKISTKLEEVKSELKKAVTDKLEVQSKLKSTEAYRAQLQIFLNEEQEAKSLLSEKLAAAISETSMWKTKLQGEAFLKMEELEAAKNELQKKLKDIDEAYTELQASYSYLDDTKNCILTELNALKFDLEKEHKNYQSLERKKKLVDKQVTDWMLRCDSKEAELDKSKNLLQMSDTKLVETRNRFETTAEALAASQKVEKHLQDELSSIENKESLTIQELGKAKNKLEADNDELANALEEVEIELASEETRLLHMQLELTQVKSETEHHIKQINAEAESTKNNLQRQLVELQKALDVVVKAKNEETKQRKLLEGEITEIRTHATKVEKALNDTLKKHRTSVVQLKELNTLCEWEHKLSVEQLEISTKAEKRAMNFELEVEDIATKMEQLQRSYQKCDGEKTDAIEHVQELQNSISILQSAKRNTEQSLSSLQEEYEELEIESKDNKEKLRTVLEQNGHLQSEILIDKNKIHSLQKTKNSLDLQVSELSSRLDIDLANAIKAAKKDASQIQAKILQLENEVVDEAKSKSDAQKALKKSDSQVKELQRQLDIEKLSSHTLQDQTNMLKRKMKNLRRDKEEEEIVKKSLLQKFKQAKAEAEEADETCSMLRAQVSKLRKAAISNVTSDDDDDDDDDDNEADTSSLPH